MGGSRGFVRGLVAGSKREGPTRYGGLLGVHGVVQVFDGVQPRAGRCCQVGVHAFAEVAKVKKRVVAPWAHKGQQSVMFQCLQAEQSDRAVRRRCSRGGAREQALRALPAALGAVADLARASFQLFPRHMGRVPGVAPLEARLSEEAGQ